MYVSDEMPVKKEKKIHGANGTKGAVQYLPICLVWHSSVCGSQKKNDWYPVEKKMVFK